MAFHPLVITWPAGRVKTSFQPLIAVAARFVMVRFSVSPVFHALTLALTERAWPEVTEQP